jgi:hypothetical protein
LYVLGLVGTKNVSKINTSYKVNPKGYLGLLPRFFDMFRKGIFCVWMGRNADSQGVMGRRVVGWQAVGKQAGTRGNAGIPEVGKKKHGSAYKNFQWCSLKKRLRGIDRIQYDCTYISLFSLNINHKKWHSCFYDR